MIALLVFLLLLFAQGAEACTRTNNGVQSCTINVSWDQVEAQVVPPPGVGTGAAEGYGVERAVRTIGGSFVEFRRVNHVAGAVRNSVDDFIPVDPGNYTYCYRVYAYNAAGRSGYATAYPDNVATEACGTTQPVQIVAPNPPGRAVLQ